MKRMAAVSAAAVMASAMALWAFADAPGEAGPNPRTGLSKAGVPSRGNPDYIEALTLHSGRQTLLVQPIVTSPDPYEFSSATGLRAHGMRVSGLNSSAQIILYDPLLNPVSFAISSEQVTVDVFFHLPIEISDGWLLLPSASVPNSVVIEIYGEPLPTKGGGGDTLIVE